MDDLTETGVAHIFIVLGLLALIGLVLGLFLWSRWTSQKGYRGNIRKVAEQYWTGKQRASQKSGKHSEPRRGGKDVKKKKKKKEY
jgi:hypothetical protein